METNHDLIVSEVSPLLDDVEAYERMSKAVNPYGDGKAWVTQGQTLWALGFFIRVSNMSSVIKAICSFFQLTVLIFWMSCWKEKNMTLAYSTFSLRIMGLL